MTLARVELGITAAYAVVAAGWIALSDVLVGSAALSVAEQTRCHLVKGLAFVAVTSVALYLLVRWALDRERSARHGLEASEAALRESEDRYRGPFESSADAIVAVDPQGRFTDANPAALKMLGYTRAELLQLDALQITPRAGTR